MTGDSERPVIVRQGRPALADPPVRVLLLHGLASNGALWESFLPRADDRAEVWVADLPWRGDGIPGWSDDGDLARSVASAVEEVPGGVEVIVAHSFAANAVLDWLDRELADGTSADGSSATVVHGLRGIVFVSPFFRRHQRDFDWASIDFYVNNFDKILAEGVRTRAAGRLAPDIVHAMSLHVRERIGPYGWMRFFEAYLHTPHLRTDRVAVPCLVLGGAHDIAARPADVHALADALPHAAAHILPGCGHFAMREQPDAFAAAANTHLAAVMGTSVHDPWERIG